VPKFDRYLLGQLIVLFGFFALVLVSIYWVNRGVTLFDKLIGEGQSTMVFLEFAALTLPNVIRLILPIAAFAGTVYVVNRMTNESELVVMQALGCSPWRLARPVLLFGLIVALPMAVLTHVLVPMSRSYLDQRQGEVANDVAARFLVEGQFLHPARGITFFIREITPGGELRDIFLSDGRSDPHSRVIFTAKRAVLVKDGDRPKLVMFDGLAQSLDRRDGRLSTTTFQDFTYDLSVLSGRGGLGRRQIDELSTRELLNPSPALLEETGKPRSAFLYEAHARSAEPLLAVAGALIGYGALLLGGFSRFGVGRQVFLAILLLIVVNFLNNSAGDVVRRDDSLWPLTYAPALSGIALGTGLIWLSARRRRRPRRVFERPA